MFCPQSVLMCIVWISEHGLLVIITEKQCVAVIKEYIYIYITHFNAFI
jgi:hypothetical protein